MSDAKFEAHIRTTAWYGVLSRAAEDDSDGASVFRMARMAAHEAWLMAGREAADALEAANARIAEFERDAKRLDALEFAANKQGGILLHDGTEEGRCGLGLRPGSLKRSLRQAVDSYMGGEMKL